MKVKVPKIFRNYVIPLVIGVAIIASLMTIVYSESLEFWPRVSFTVATIAAIFAGISALVARQSLEKTKESLELTRNTTRPFLTVTLVLSKGMSLDRAILTPEIQNTGSLPADNVSVDCVWYIQENNNSEEYPLRLEKESPKIFFPRDKMGPTYLIQGKQSVNNITHGGSRVRIIVKYQNKLTLEQHNTHRTFKLAYASALPSVDAAQPIPIPEEDYWD